MTRTQTALVRLLALSAAACHPTRGRDSAPPRVLTSVEEIRRLSPQELASGLTVNLHGVVTSYGHEGYIYYLQDATGGIRMDPIGGRGHPFELGDVVRVDGITAAGPTIVRTQIEWLGQAAMPAARRLSPEGLHNPGLAGDWIETEGVVRGAALERGLLVLTLGQEKERLRAALLGFDEDDGLALVGARVSLRGVLARPGTGARAETLVYVPTLAEVKVVAREAAPVPAAAVAPKSALPTLTRIEQVRSMTTEEAEKAYPVHVRGTITFYLPPLLFIQDETRGIYVRLALHDPLLRAGQQVELRGVTGPGQFAPIIDIPRIKILGPTAMPAPQRTTLERLFSGEMDAQWVEVDGLVVRRIDNDRITLASGYHQVKAWLPLTEVQPPPLHLLNARVKVRGVPNVYFNEKRQVMGIGISVYSLREIAVTEPAPEPASLRVSPINSLLRFSPEGGMEHRIRIQGTLMVGRGGHTLYVADETGAAQVQTEEDAGSLWPGDRVDVLGFPSAGAFTPVLLDAIVRKTGSGPVREPAPITAAEAMVGQHDLEWVQISGRLLDVTEGPREQTLTLQSDRTVFTAHLDGKTPLALRNGSLLRLTGVCSVQVDENRQVRGFQMLLRSAQDVAVLASPPWIKVEHVAFLFAVLGTIGFLVHRLHLVKVRAGFKAVSEERTRLAREIHDTLQQRLVGVLMQLEIMAQRKDAPERTRESVDETRTLVRSSMAEARRLVLNLRSPALDQGDLRQALQSVVEQLSVGSRAHIDLRVVGTPRRLPDATENNLLRIGQEALVNAIKHGEARHIHVELRFDPTVVRLDVQDDGRGFDGTVAHDRSGHFGVLGMRERAQQLGGKLDLRSELGSGTSVRVAVPLEG